MNPDILAAWIAAGVAILSTAATAIVGIVMHRIEKQDERKAEIHRMRQEALLLALDVIDHAYSNTSFGGKPPSNPHKWDISLARTAMNKMIAYCDDPDKAVGTFLKAMGVWNPDEQATPATYGPRDLADFRKIVCRELQLPESGFNDASRTWIASLPGTKEP
jgi:hypothetical protein